MTALRSLLAVAVAVLAPALIPATAASATARSFDFDGDGRQDLTAGVPGWSEAGTREAGAVVVLRGTPRGASLSERFITRSTPGVPGEPRRDAHLGFAAASGDFDGDRYADLAVSAPGESSTLVLYGAAGGLTGARSLSLPVTGGLAAGDLDGDGRSDLVIGVRADDFQADDPGLPLDDYYGSGSLRVVRGGPAGLDPATMRTIRRPRRSDAGFGSVLAIGDVDGDGRADIVEAAQGTPHWVDDPPVPGHLSWCPGAPGGPVSCVSVGRPAPGPTALAVGDVTGDGVADLVAGVPVTRPVREDGREPAGVVRLWRGGPGGPPATTPLRIRQSTAGVPGDDQDGDRFGASVVVARVDSDRRADIVVGAPGEDEGRGRVTLIRGARSGLATRGNRAFRPARRSHGAFGTAAALVDLTGDRRPELVIGEPGAPGRLGAVYVMRGRRGGPVAGRTQRITLATLGRRPSRDAPDVAWPFGSILGG